MGQNVTTEEAQHRDIPDKSNLPPREEEIPGINFLLGHEETIGIRCTLSRWTHIVKNLSEEQKEVVRALGFGTLLALNCRRLHLRIFRWLVDNFDTTTCSIHIHDRRFAMNSNIFGRVLGIFDQGDQISIFGDVPDKVLGIKDSITSRCIFLKDIEHWLKYMTMTEDEFKVALCLFLLGTILSLSATDYVQAGYLIPLMDVGSIYRKNLSSWCFTSLYEWNKKFHMNRHRMKSSCISGCVLLFLQLFYLHSLLWESPLVDKELIPIICWTNVKIKKCLIRLHKEGGVGSNQISIEDIYNQPSAPGG
ncbi:hypothetical protein Ddye_012913 [Dipteronia dyeriana]|uniref:Uncharacterized protein n=1 Tax=Dipteronia dyeriana TaxID=168575 RepID=A0AAD9X5F7_9ROSI|nr:hypothetical protein Ddye_012913 [Dipteronia dyeriana]